MLRLRTTTGLSLLALVVGIAGTAWLSTFTDQWKGPAGVVVTNVDKVRTVLRRHSRPAHPSSAPSHEPVTTLATVSRAEAAPALPTLTPIDMPSLPGSLFARTVQAHGRVVLRLTVDSEGRAQSASVAQSSGNAELDDRAVRMALGWRYAVPSDHPGGLTGQLVMRFDQ